MSAAVDLLSDPDGRDTKLHQAPSLLTWRDLGIPLLCTAVVVGELYYLSQVTLGASQANILEIDNLVLRTREHVVMTLTITVIVLALAVPFGVLITRPRFRWLASPVLALGNIGQAAPIVGLLAIIGSFVFGFWPVVGMIAAFSILPVLRNTIVGIEQVDVGVKDAARGMGMSPMGVLMRVELPLAIPIIAAGTRTALILAVAVIPLGTDMNAGALGELVFAGIKLNRAESLVCGALLIAVLALLVDWASGLAQRALTPRGIR
ncbi:MAG: ABC transporter permease [Nocardioidaceae bacterium]|nr:ABC transporter permease [Nocardioidaceae bacterium]